MTATLELPKNVAISMLRKAGTGDSLLDALNALVNTDNSEVQVEENQEPQEWVNAVNLENQEENADNGYDIQF